MNFLDKLNKAIEKNNSLVCVGLDSDFDKLPQSVKDENHEHPQFEFNKDIINATADLVCAYKPNTAFYEARGEEGVKELKLTCDYINNMYPYIPIILDAKRADIGNTNIGYMKFAYDYLNVDAVTLQPYLGGEALKPFLEVKDKGVIILCRTSNPGAGEFQDLFVIPNLFRDPQQSQDEMLKQVQHDTPEKLYQIVAKKVANEWNSNGNCLLVVGATYPEELAEIRKITGDMTFLVPGVGAQGGDVEATVKAGLNSEKRGLIINSSRGIIFASKEEDFDERAREEAQKLRDQINQYR